jgi:predicted metal-dependent peptidase
VAPIPDTLRRAINYLTLEQEFFAALLFEMKLVEVEDNNPPPRILGRDQKQTDYAFTMGTDGYRIFWSRKFVSTLNVPQCAFVLCHEVCHPMLLHLARLYEHGISGKNWTPKADTHGRLISRDPIIWNVAGDYLINAMLKEAGFQMPPVGLLSDNYTIAKGWTTEKVYNDLLQNATVIEVSGIGPDLVEPPPDADLEAAAEEMKDRIVRAAAIAKSRGHLPSSIEALIKEYTEPVYPVWLLLERYVDMVLRDDDYSWYRPHPNFLPHGIILPGSYSERVSRVDVWYDTSGSVSDEDLSKFHKVGGDIIRNAAPATLAIGQCDAGVHSYTEIRQPSDWLSEIHVTGRGGTSFKPPFAYLAEHRITPSLLIYLTDLQGDFPPEPPPYPVLWVSTTPESAPFGTTLHLKE